MFDLNDIDRMVATAAGQPQDVIDVENLDADSVGGAALLNSPVFSLSSLTKTEDVLLLGTDQFTPSELESFSEFYTLRRPNLLRNNQPYKDGISRYYMPLDSPDGRCGWYLVTENECVAITDDPELEEAYSPEFYGGAIPSVANGDGYKDQQMIDINSSLIRAMASDYLFSIKDKLTANWSANKVFTLSSDRNGDPDSMKFIHISEDGTLTAKPVNKASTQLVKAKDLFPVVDSWCRLNKVMWDVYRSRFMIQDRPMLEKKLPSMISAVCNEMDINIKTSEFKNILIGLAMDNEYNSLMDRYTELEKLAELKLLEPYDHRHLARDFLKIKDDPEHEEYADAVLEHMVEKMVIRAFYPGFPHRSTPILHGPQQGGKSGFLQALCGDEHFVEIQSLSKGANDHSGAAHPDTQKKLTQNNLVVINEIGRVLEVLDDSSMKDFITGETASYVDKYQSDITKRGRTSVIVGTTNTPYILKDLTGNTRYQIIHCGMTQDDPVDWEKLERVQRGILLSALIAVRELTKKGLGALKAHTLPNWVMEYSEAQNLNYLANSEFIGLLSTLVTPGVDGASGRRTTISGREVAKELDLKPSEVKGAKDEIDRAMKQLGYVLWPRRARFNGQPSQTLYVLEGLPEPAKHETASDVIVTVNRKEDF